MTMTHLEQSNRGTIGQFGRSEIDQVWNDLLGFHHLRVNALLGSPPWEEELSGHYKVSLVEQTIKNQTNRNKRQRNQGAKQRSSVTP